MRTRLGELDEKIEPMVTERDALRAFLRTAGVSLADDAQDEGDVAPERIEALPVRDQDDFRLEEIGGDALVEAALSILRETPDPLNAQTILDRMRERGLTCRGKDPRNNLYAHVHRSGKARKVSRGLWRPDPDPFVSDAPADAQEPEGGDVDD